MLCWDPRPPPFILSCDRQTVEVSSLPPALETPFHQGKSFIRAREPLAEPSCSPDADVWGQPS